MSAQGKEKHSCQSLFLRWEQKILALGFQGTSRAINGWKKKRLPDANFQKSAAGSLLCLRGRVPTATTHMRLFICPFFCLLQSAPAARISATPQGTRV